MAIFAINKENCYELVKNGVISKCEMFLRDGDITDVREKSILWNDDGDSKAVGQCFQFLERLVTAIPEIKGFFKKEKYFKFEIHPRLETCLPAMRFTGILSTERK